MPYETEEPGDDDTEIWTRSVLYPLKTWEWHDGLTE